MIHGIWTLNSQWGIHGLSILPSTSGLPNGQLVFPVIFFLTPYLNHGETNLMNNLYKGPYCHLSNLGATHWTAYRGMCFDYTSPFRKKNETKWCFFTILRAWLVSDLQEGSTSHLSFPPNICFWMFSGTKTCLSLWVAPNDGKSFFHLNVETEQAQSIKAFLQNKGTERTKE